MLGFRNLTGLFLETFSINLFLLVLILSLITYLSYFMKRSCDFLCIHLYTFLWLMDWQWCCALLFSELTLDTLSFLCFLHRWRRNGACTEILLPLCSQCLSKLFLLISPLPSQTILWLWGFPIKLLGLPCFKLIFYIFATSAKLHPMLLPLQECLAHYLFSSLSIWPMDLKKQSFITAYLTCNSLIKCLYIIRKQFHGHFPGYSNICKW